MSISIGANGNTFSYPEENDTGWGTDATNWASAVSAALSSLGLGATLSADAVIELNSTTKGFKPPRMTTVQRDAISAPTEGLLIYNTTLDTIDIYDGSAWISLINGASLTANRILIGTGDTISSSTASIVGNDITVVGSVSSASVTSTGVTTTGGLSTSSDITATAAIDFDLVDNNASALSFDATGKAGILEIDTTDSAEKVKMSGGLDVTGILTNGQIKATGSGGVLIEASNGTDVMLLGAGNTANGTFYGTLNFDGGVGAPDGSITTPGIHFKDDTNTGFIRSATDQIDIVTGGQSRFRIESTGQIKAVYESTTGTDYNTTLHNGYLCRAWVNFSDTTGTVVVGSSGNISSITDNGTGDYTANFTTNMPDVNYSLCFGSKQIGTNIGGGVYPSSRLVGSVRCVFTNFDTSPAARDQDYVSIGVFR